MSDTVNDGVRSTVWNTEPDRLSSATFDLGAFDKETLTTHKGLIVDVFKLQNQDDAHQARRREQVSQILSSVSLFDSLLAPYPFPRLVLVEGHGTYGESYPGYIRFGKQSKLVMEFGINSYRYKTVELNCINSVAHQWFGNVIRLRTGCDLWLTDGLAEYLGACYREIQGGFDPSQGHSFSDIVDVWKSTVLSEPPFESLQGVRAFDPIPTGERLVPNWITPSCELRYSKGAYVINMLRSLIRKRNANSDLFFFVMLNEFVRSHYLGEISTEDFIKMTESYYHGSLSWFFNEYVYDFFLPHCRWDVSTDHTPSAPYLVTVHVVITDVPQGFRMLVPFVVNLKENLQYFTALDIDQTDKTFSFQVPEEPIEYLFNAGNDALCIEERVQTKGN